MSKINLGTITSEDDKKKYIYTIQLEKARITRKTLKGVYENAFDLYNRGQYDSAKELTAKILSIDPNYEDASILRRASIELNGSDKPRSSKRKLVEDKFEEGMALYRQGRLVEAAARWEEATKLSTVNLKAKYWLKKARRELSEEHFRRGQRAYRQHRLREALDQWYAALVLNPRYPQLSRVIAKAEAEAREQQANQQLQTALNLYSQGSIGESLKMLDSVLESGPGNVKAQKLRAEIRSEMASQHVAQGRRFYERHDYQKAIAEWETAKKYGYSTRAANQLVARAKERMQNLIVAKQKAQDRRKEAEEKARLDAEEKAKRDAEEKEKADAAAKEDTQTAGPTGSGSPANANTNASAPDAGGRISEDAKRSSQQHYLSGVIYFQKGDYAKARDEWTRAKQLDPSNSDAIAGLDRIEKLYGGQ
jgi:tetratricopeptide (TPR) repeat protein